MRSRYYVTGVLVAAVLALVIFLSISAMGPKVRQDAGTAVAQRPSGAPMPRAEDAMERQRGFDALVSVTTHGFQPPFIAIEAGQTIRFINNTSIEVLLKGTEQSPS